MFIVKYRKIFYSISIFFLIASFFSIFFFGLNLGIDFKGGSSLEFVYSNERPNIDSIKEKINSLDFSPSIKDTYKIVPVGEKGYNLNLRNITEDERSSLVSLISSETENEVEIKKFNSVGPILGKEAARKSLVSIILVILFIILYLTFAFRKVSEPVSSWKYGIISVLALIHDIIIPTGIFATLGYYFIGFEINTLFVTAILVILGFSVHDTIVVFDRIRENLKESRLDKKHTNFDEIVGMSISQTMTRSINTSITTLFAVLMVYLFGPASIKSFSLILIIGVLFGTYSSIFIASNLLITVEKFKKRSVK